jgi:hypothetical protein
LRLTVALVATVGTRALAEATDGLASLQPPGWRKANAL